MIKDIFPMAARGIVFILLIGIVATSGLLSYAYGADTVEDIQLEAMVINNESNIVEKKNIFAFDELVDNSVDIKDVPTIIIDPVFEDNAIIIIIQKDVLNEDNVFVLNINS